MIDYQLTNLADRVCFQAPDRIIAAIVVSIVSEGQCGATVVERSAGHQTCDDDVPIFIIGGFDEFWNKATGGKEPDFVTSIIAARKGEISASLRSMMYGESSERADYNAGLSACADDAASQEFTASWNAARRTSDVDVTIRAHEIAKHLYEELVREVL